MNDILPAKKIRELSIIDRLRLIDEVWMSLSAHPEVIPLPDWHRGELDKRLAAPELDNQARNWDVARGEIIAKLKR